jgi:hypothetical protein
MDNIKTDLREIRLSVVDWIDLAEDRGQGFFLNVIMQVYRSRDSAVGIATGYGLNDRGV